MDQDLEVLDFDRGLTDSQKETLVAVDTVPSELIDSAWKLFIAHGTDGGSDDKCSSNLPELCTIYEHKDFPGMPPSRR